MRWRRLRGLTPSPKPLLSKGQRGVSRVVWGQWLKSFIVRELLGNQRWCPWKTFSETVWDVEKHHPGTKRMVLAFALALADHMLFRTELRASWEWALTRVDDFEDWIRSDGGR